MTLQASIERTVNGLCPSPAAHVDSLGVSQPGVRYSGGKRTPLPKHRAASNSHRRIACKNAAGSAGLARDHERRTAIDRPLRKWRHSRGGRGVGRTQCCAEGFESRLSTGSGRAATDKATVRVPRFHSQVHRPLWQGASRIRHRAPLPRLCTERQPNDANARASRLHCTATRRPSLDSSLR